MLKNEKPICCAALGQPKEKIICNGMDLQTKEIVEFHLPKSLVVRIQEAIHQKPTRLQKILMWIEKLFGQAPRKKVITITSNGKTYEIKNFTIINTFFFFYSFRRIISIISF